MDYTPRSSERPAAEQKNDTAAAVAVLELLLGQSVARCIQVAADLGLADAFNAGPRSVQEVAQATGTHAPTLQRLLRTLASRGIFVEVEPGYFAHTALSEVLRTDRPDSIAPVARLYGSEWQWRAWRELEYSIRTGQAAMEHAYNQKTWEYFAAHPDDARLFQQAMTSTSAFITRTLVESYDFTPFATVMDIGGGHGSLLKAILSTSPQTKGVLFDLPQVIEGARKHLPPEFQERMQLVPGDFFVSVPSGGDAYILKQVLHDWNDADCVRILKTCRQAMKPESKLLVIDTVIGSAPAGQPSLGELMDLLVLVIHAGHERTQQEFSDLFAASGFKLTRVIPTGSPVSIVEGALIS